MNKKALLLLSLFVLPLHTIACADSTDEEDAAPVAGDDQDIITTRTSVILDENDDGITATVNVGQSVIVELPSNPSTGHAWKVVSTDRTFGYPTEEYLAPDTGALGAGGIMKLTWKTQSALPMVGRHSVKLEYQPPGGGPAAKTFTFTVDVVRGSTPAPDSSVKLSDADDGRTVDVPAGKDVVVELESNASTGYSWKVVSTDRTFGYGQEEFISGSSGALGAPGKQRFTWKTSGPLPIRGRHTVRLEYRQPWAPDAPARSFTFTVSVL